MQKLINTLILAALGVAGITFYFQERKSAQLEAEVEKLKRSVTNVVNYDSIVSAAEKRLLDSIKTVRESLEETKQFQHDENRRLRRRNEDLERRFRDLDLGDRPDF